MSTGIKRFQPTCDCMSQANWGDYVLHADHLAAIEVERTKVAELEAVLHQATKNGYQFRYEGWGGRWKVKTLSQPEALELFRKWAAQAKELPTIPENADS